MALTYGELFAGYGGLGLGVQSVLGGEMAWCAEFDKAPSTILAHHWPNVPNLGDVTKIDWASLPPVDVITGGSPCQDLSHAGKRAGMKAGTRSGLWASMCDAIDIIRPGLVVWENVRGALSAEADSAMEPCPGCVGGGDDGPVLRALGRVLGDLAELRYDTWWIGLRAADAGAPHGRFRIFVFAWPAAKSDREQRQGVGTLPRLGRGPDSRGDVRVLTVPGSSAAPDAPSNDIRDAAQQVAASASDVRRDLGDSGLPLGVDRGGSDGAIIWGQYAAAVARWEAAVGRTAPAPTQPEGGLDADPCEARPGEVVSDVRCDVHAAQVRAEAGRPDEVPDASVLLPVVREQQARGDEGGAPPARQENVRGAVRDLPSDERAPRPPQGQEPSEQRPVESGDAVRVMSPETALAGGPGQAPSSSQVDWGQYAQAIRRWEVVLGRQAPAPTEPGKNGNPRLSPKFVEFLMGLPAGHVTDVPGITRNDQLKALGNGVVPQQAALATRMWLAHMTQQEAA